MKIFSRHSAGRRRRRQSAFTMVEMMVSIGIYLMIFVGVVLAIQVFAMRVYTLAATKLTATQSSREALNQIRDDIRQGKGLLVGASDNGGNFAPCSTTNGAVGNALKIFGTTNFSGPPFTLYYLQTNTVGGISSNNLLAMFVSAGGTNFNNLATYITNMDVFAAEDCYGNVISNYIQNNQVFTIKLQFYQWEYPIAVISTNGGYNAYDYYQLRTKVCRRALD
jgi:type II secretory pathway pseudopilin PulG